MHYLDNAATTQVIPAAAEAVLRAMTEQFGNPSSVHKLGVEAERVVTTAREQVAAALGCNPSELTFTSGGTEADNLAILRGAELGARRGKHVITSQTEHAAVLNSAKYLEQHGFEVTYLPPEKNGSVSEEKLAAALREDTVLVSLMLVNNETGARSPIEKLAALTHERSPHALFHCDAVQAFLKEKFTPRDLGVDLLSISSHKIHGPKGAGALWVKNGVRLKPLLLGGGQEKGLRSGTEAVPAIAGFGAAAAIGASHVQFYGPKLNGLMMRLLFGLEDLEQVHVIEARGAIACFAVPKYPSEVLIRMLADKDIYLSGGSACARGKESHVLQAMGVDRTLIKSAVRASLSWENSDADVMALLAALRNLK